MMMVSLKLSSETQHAGCSKPMVHVASVSPDDTKRGRGGREQQQHLGFRERVCRWCDCDDGIFIDHLRYAARRCGCCSMEVIVVMEEVVLSAAARGVLLLLSLALVTSAASPLAAFVKGLFSSVAKHDSRTARQPERGAEQENRAPLLGGARSGIPMAPAAPKPSGGSCALHSLLHACVLSDSPPAPRPLLARYRKSDLILLWSWR